MENRPTRTEDSPRRRSAPTTPPRPALRELLTRWVEKKVFGEKKKKSADEGALGILALAMFVGFAAAFVYGFQAQSSVRSGLWSTAVFVGGAALALGGLLGFLFGIPRSPREEQPSSGPNAGAANQTSGRYRGNTNLEDISDWLSKILLGIGFAQLGSLVAGFSTLGDFLEPALGDFSTSKLFGMTVVVYFTIGGFLYGFLWARLHFGRLLSQAEVEQKAEQRGKVEALDLLDEVLRHPKLFGGKRILWVDDNADDVKRDREMLETHLGVTIRMVTTTDEAIKDAEDAKTKDQGYDLIISDMARPGDTQAGYSLLDKVKDKNIPYVIYSTSMQPEKEAEAIEKGATGGAATSADLLLKVSSALGKHS
ncbi:MAG: hypothetical protein HY681_14145 [Chloroflexi bacterium]|nr:hypothetical protein [Chloroflexota bacterium]